MSLSDAREIIVFLIALFQVGYIVFLWCKSREISKETKKHYDELRQALPALQEIVGVTSKSQASIAEEINKLKTEMTAVKLQRR